MDIHGRLISYLSGRNYNKKNLVKSPLCHLDIRYDLLQPNKTTRMMKQPICFLSPCVRMLCLYGSCVYMLELHPIQLFEAGFYTFAD